MFPTSKGCNLLQGAGNQAANVEGWGCYNLWELAIWGAIAPSNIPGYSSGKIPLYWPMGWIFYPHLRLGAPSMFKVSSDINNNNLRYMINIHTYNSPQSFDSQHL
jgi:hypothetical protein